MEPDYTNAICHVGRQVVHCSDKSPADGLTGGCSPYAGVSYI
jgi:hypothetical protein